MAVLSKSEIAALSVDERLALIDELWESIEGPVDDSTELPEWQRRALDQRLEETNRSPDASVLWKDVREGLLKKWVL